MLVTLVSCHYGFIIGLKSQMQFICQQNINVVGVHFSNCFVVANAAATCSASPSERSQPGEVLLEPQMDRKQQVVVFNCAKWEINTE